MNMVGEQAVYDYLVQLERSMRDLPAARRKEIFDEIVEHIDETIADLESDLTEADVRNVLERVGEPDDIAREARQRLGLRPQRISWTDPTAIALLLVGGFFWGVGWVVGLVFLWLSDVWSTRDKLVATLVVPFGLALPVFLAVFTLPGTSCSQGFETVNGVTRMVSSTCTEGVERWVPLAVFLVLVIAPIGTAIHLGRKLRRVRAVG